MGGAAHEARGITKMGASQGWDPACLATEMLETQLHTMRWGLGNKDYNVSEPRDKEEDMLGAG